MLLIAMTVNYSSQLKQLIGSATGAVRHSHTIKRKFAYLYSTLKVIIRTCTQLQFETRARVSRQAQ